MLKLFEIIKLILIFIIIFEVINYYNKMNENFSDSKRKKYIVVTYSESEKKPVKGVLGGIAGMRHVQGQILNKLNKLGKLFNRTVVLPPPWLVLENIHNNNKVLDKNIKWSHYFNFDDQKNIDLNPPFRYRKNGSIKNKNLSIKYYPYDYILDYANFKKIDHDVDILVIVKYKNLKKNEQIFDALKINNFDNFNKIYKKNIKFKISDKLKNYGDNIIKKLKLKNYIFIHIRRGDFLNNKILAPPNGTKEYTNPEYIFKFLKHHKLKNDNIIIATNEKDKKYKDKLIKIMKNKNIYLEKDFLKYLPNDIINDNFSIYEISNYIAKKSNINIVTMHLKLGNKIDFNLSEKIK